MFSLNIMYFELVLTPIMDGDGLIYQRATESHLTSP
jgi:hypothetical protein